MSPLKILWKRGTSPREYPEDTRIPHRLYDSEVLGFTFLGRKTPYNDHITTVL
ncbi:Hypothetical predicted protein, partial [Olea europaea subsp. europaea]